VRWSLWGLCAEKSLVVSPGVRPASHRFTVPPPVLLRSAALRTSPARLVLAAHISLHFSPDWENGGGGREQGLVSKWAIGEVAELQRSAVYGQDGSAESWRAVAGRAHSCEAKFPCDLQQEQ